MACKFQKWIHRQIIDNVSCKIVCERDGCEDVYIGKVDSVLTDECDSVSQNGP